jgi:hypothetical protein
MRTATRLQIDYEIQRAPRARQTCRLVRRCERDRTLTWCLPAVTASACIATTLSVAISSSKASVAGLRLVNFDVPGFEVRIFELTDRVGGFFRSLISTKPKPFDCPENWSLMTAALCTWPTCQKSS